MRTSMWGITRGVLVRLTLLGASLLILGFTVPAFATLGGDVSSVELDRARMNATVTITEANGYSVHEIKDSHGSIVREYVSSDGRVFGIAWQGPFFPDMRQLLGTYFQQYLAGVKAQHDAGPGRRPLNIQQPSLVVYNAGHMRSFHGRAYDPGLLPEGITASAIR